MSHRQRTTEDYRYIGRFGRKFTYAWRGSFVIASSANNDIIFSKETISVKDSRFVLLFIIDCSFCETTFLVAKIWVEKRFLHRHESFMTLQLKLLSHTVSRHQTKVIKWNQSVGFNRFMNVRIFFDNLMVSFVLSWFNTQLFCISVASEER